MSVAKYLLAFLFVLVYAYAGYFMHELNMATLALVFGVSFALYFYFIFYTKDKDEVNTLLWFSMLFRLSFLAAIPVVSTDYIRYLWDGKLLLNGINPYLHSPSDFFSTSPQWFVGSFSVLQTDNTPTFIAPLLHVFTIPAAFFNEIHPILGLAFLRIPIIIADFVIIKLLIRILNHLKLSYSGLLIYALNPLVIIGLTANVNLFGMMLCLLLISIFLFINHKWLGGAVLFGLSSAISLFPLVLFPVLLKKLKTAKFIVFTVILAIILGLGWLPFFHSTYTHLVSNYIVASFSNNTVTFGLTNVLNWFAGNTIVIIPTLLLLAIFSIAISRVNDWMSIIKGMLFCFAAFALLSNTIEPHYFVLAVLFSVLVQEYSFAIIWSFIAVVNYVIGVNGNFENQHLFMAVEYSLLLMLFLLDWISHFRKLPE
ncbi:MAG: hypothetical protein KF732_03075 [Flavobacteriales bacterium]|nr:hypothetical protein [Flavobacteriales bacterium]